MVNGAPGASSEQLSRAIQGLVASYPALTLVDSAVFRESQNELFGNVEQVYWGLLLAMALPGLIAMINTLAINVVERTREIGVLRAVGTTRSQVGKIILGESVLLATTGIAFGIVGGLWLGYVLVLGLSTLGFVLPYDFPWAGVLASIAVGLLFGVLAALLPARQAARLPIVVALRYE
jgi:putative ABC transport system permease protein